MRVFAATLIILFACAIINAIRQNTDLSHIVGALPFLGGKPPSLSYDVVGGLAMIALFLWGLGRLARKGGDAEYHDELDDTEYELEPDDEDNDESDEGEE